MKFSSKKTFLSLSIIVLVVLVTCALDISAQASWDECEEFSGKAIISCSDGDSGERLLDANYSTRCIFDDGDTISIRSPENVQGIYVIWDRVPGTWLLTLDDGTQIECGKNGFIHEYVAVGGSRSLTITILADDTRLCDVYLFGAGELPDWVQVWQPPYEQADMLIVSTHADDEALFYGGLLPTYAREYGYKVQMAYLTNHWKEHLRPHELLCGLWEAGIKAYPQISGFEDWNAYGGRYSSEDFEKYEVWLLRRFKPTVVVTQDLNGEYGHPTHIMGSNAMLRAVVAAADPAQYVESAQEYGTWQVQKYYIHMYEKNQLVMNWHIPLRTFGGKTGIEIALDSYSCHHSQLHLDFAVRESGYGDCRLFGLYSSTVGEDTGLDLMENTGIAPENGLFASMAGINDADAQGGTDSGA